jgi:sulfite reductase (NADPH) hemoprotein beta-component
LRAPFQRALASESIHERYLQKPPQSRSTRTSCSRPRATTCAATSSQDLQDPSSGTISEDSAQLTKFHGVYPQDDRDLRAQRRKEGKEKAYIFMARVRVPGGVCTPKQWLAIDALSDSHANGTLKITNRQAFQFHGIIKGKPAGGDSRGEPGALDTLAACGDVNRNVMCNPNPHLSGLHAETLEIVRAVANTFRRTPGPTTSFGSTTRS